VPKFVDSGIFDKISWEPADVIVSSGPKQGTNWLLNIVHQLRMSGDDSFEDILSACLWLEVLSYPDESYDQRLQKIESHKKKYSFRIFKTHDCPTLLPFHDTIKYIIPVRNGKDTLISDYYFSQKKTSEFFELWNGRESKPLPFASYFKRYVKRGYYWEFLNSWWQYRHHKNVFMIHFNDLKKDPEKNIRKIASFLDIEVPEDRWPIVLKYCSFEWMKGNAHKFEAPEFMGTGKMIKDGGMIRNGAIGEHQNLFSDTDNYVWEKSHHKKFSDDLQREWSDHGDKKLP